jgi:hypothetical protein
MLKKRKASKKKTIAMTLMRDVQGSVAQTIAMFEKEDPADLGAAETMLRAFVAWTERYVQRWAAPPMRYLAVIRCAE